MLIRLRGNIPKQVGLGWKPGRGTNPQAFRSGAVLPKQGMITHGRKLWWANGWWGDQGLQEYSKSECTIFGSLHAIHDGPITPKKRPYARIIKPIRDPNKLYIRGQQIDGTDPADRESGLTCDAAAKVFREEGLIGEWRWAESVDEAVNWLLNVGPATIGKPWWWDDFELAPSGLLRMSGGYAGGHLTKMDGVDTINEVVWDKNSWSRQWGHARSLHPSGGAKRGFYGMTFKQLDNLLTNEGAEICMFRELPSMERLVA